MYSDWPRDAYFEIIGVIADAKNHGLQDPPRPEAYFPYTLTGIGILRVMVRVAGNSSGILTSMRREISTLDPDLAVLGIGSVDSFLKRSYFAETQFVLIGLGTFTAIGLLTGDHRRVQRYGVHRFSPDPRDRRPDGTRSSAR